MADEPLLEEEPSVDEEALLAEAQERERQQAEEAQRKQEEAKRKAEALQKEREAKQRAEEEAAARERERQERLAAEEQASEINKVFDVVEQMPRYPGGDAALMSFLGSNIHYPPVAEENGIQGRVVCTFVVERDGSISDVKVAKSVDPSLDKEALRVVRSMPRWNPGKQNGKAVRVKYTVPITFRLQ